MRRLTLIALVALLAGLLAAGLLASAATAQTGGGYELTWSTVDGGGGTSTGGSYSVTGTAGQPDAGTASGGGYTVAGGFWGRLAGALHEIFVPLITR